MPPKGLVVSLFVPCCFPLLCQGKNEQSTCIPQVLLLSRVCALFLIFLYLSFIYFHLKTHKAGGNKRPVSQAFRGARRKAIFRAMRVPAK